MSDLSIYIESNDENKTDKSETTNKDVNSKPYNGKPITMIEISPNGNYLVTFSEEDKSFVGWNVENIDEGQLGVDKVYYLESSNIKVKQMCVSGDKKLVYYYFFDINYFLDLKIIDMNNNNQEIKLYFDKSIIPDYCTFNLKGEFILCSGIFGILDKFIWIYSTKTKNNKWNCINIYAIPDNFYLISISKYDKLYLLSNDYYIYEWDILTEKSVKIFGYDEIKKHIKYNELKTMEDIKDIRISSNERFICLKIKDKIIIYSIELEIPIASLCTNNSDIQLYNFMNDLDPDLYTLLYEQITSNGIWNSIMKYCCNKYLGHLKQFPKEYQPENLSFLFCNDNTTIFVCEILDGHIWKIKTENILKIRKELEEWISKMIENFDENDVNDRTIESWNIYLDNECDHLNINPYELTQDLNLKVNIDNKKIQLQAFKKDNVNNEWYLICTRDDDHSFVTENINYRIFGIKLFNDNDIFILTTIGLFIYYFNENDNSISLKGFYITNLVKHHEEKIKKELQDYYKIVSSKHEWVSSAKDNKLSLLKYGVELLLFAIKKQNLELIDDIYKKCINYFKQDLKNNRVFLGIITSAMPILNDYYPDYISRYSLETAMVIDSPFYNIKRLNNHLHLYSFSKYPQIVNLTQSILWTKYTYLNYCLYENHKIMFWILFCIQSLIILLTFPIYFATFYILSKYHFINNIYKSDVFSLLYFEMFDNSEFSKRTTTSTITFMIPYIKFVNYPRDYNYNWFWELVRPQPSPFVKTISKDVYETLNGEVLFSFKWNTYGKYYYAIIWIMFIALFGCFITAAIIPLAEDVRNKLLIASIILGFIHLITEIRQIIYDPNKWIHNFWKMFDMIAYLLPIYTSIYWLQTNNMNDQIIQLLSFSCLILFIKFSMFFRVIGIFGVYFAIIINVGRRILSFLVIMLIIIMGFASAFYILLLPRSVNDPNSPLNMATTYNKVLDNGTIDSNPFMIQTPDGNTNMFVDYRTALLAMYFFLTGDSSSLTNWSYIKNPSLVILIILFSLLVVVYLMNLFIGLLNMEIGNTDNRFIHLKWKAEVLAEIELFYLLPHQRRWQEWFPDTIYYYASVDKTREKVNEMIDKKEWKTNDFPEMKQDLLNKLNIKHNHDN